MGKLLLKSVLFIALLLAASQLLIRPFVYHPFWGDTDYMAKYDHFFTEENDYNTVFIGSSRTFRHVNPVLFDSIAGTKSFNYGIVGIGCPFNYLLTKDIIQSEQADQLDYIILELFSPRGSLIKEIMHSNKVLFRYGWADFSFTVRAIWQDCTLSNEEKVDETSIHFRNLTETAFRFGQLHRIANSKDKPTLDRLGKDGRGFLNGDFELKNNPDSFLINKHNKFLLNPEILKDCTSYSRSKSGSPQIGEDCFQYHWNYLLNLQNDCTAKGINLILIVPPLMSEKQVNFFNSFLPHAPISLTILNYSNSDHYPEYYQIENVFDKAHLNTKGAKLFTTKLATDFNLLLEQPNK